MLRTIRNVHLGCIVQGFQFSNDGAAVTISKGSHDTASAARTAAGTQTITLREPGLFKRGPICLVTPFTNVAAGTFGTYNTLPASGVITSKIIDSAGSGDDGDGFVITAGFMQSFTDKIRTPKQLVKGTWPSPILTSLRVTNPSGTAAIASGSFRASIVRNGTGDVTITYNRAFVMYKSVAVTCEGSTPAYAQVAAISASSIQIKTYDSAGAALDTNLNIHFLASMRNFHAGRMRKLLQALQPYPRIVLGRITNNGTAAITIGGATNGTDFSIVRNGAGDVSVTFSDPCKRLPVICATGKTTNAQLKAAPTVNGFQVLCSNDSGTATDDDFDFMAMMYDSTSEV